MKEVIFYKYYLIQFGQDEKRFKLYKIEETIKTNP